MKSSRKGNLNLRLCDFLLHYRTTPHGTTNASPSELLMKVKPKTLMDLIRPDVDAKVRVKQEMQEEHFTGNTHTREFYDGQSVWVQTFSKDSPKWSLGTFVRSVGPVSYDVEVDDRVMKRHVDHILSGEVVGGSPAPSSPSSTPTRSTPFHSASNSPIKMEAVSVPASPEIPCPVDTAPEEAEEFVESSRPQRQRKAPDRLQYS